MTKENKLTNKQIKEKKERKKEGAHTLGTNISL